MSDRPPVRRIRLIRIAILLPLAVGAIYAVRRAIPPRDVTIETGPVGGSYYETALKYREVMQRHGIELRLRPNPDSLVIIDDVDRAGSDVDIGFTAQAVRREQYPRTEAAGAIELQPLFVFYNIGRLGGLATPSSLRGKQIVLPTEQSATSRAALEVLNLYGVTRANTRIAFMQLDQAVHALESGQADAGLFMLAPSNGFITEMAQSDPLRLLSETEGKGITRHLPFLRTTVLSRGSFDIDNNIPPDDVELVAATVNVVVRKNIHPAVLYMLLEAMKEVHRGTTLISDAGEFPSVSGTDLLPHPLAPEYAKSGLPWTYREMPLSIASLIDYYFVIGVTILILAEIYKNLKYLSEMTNLLVENLCLRLLAHIERSATPDRPISGLRLVIVHLIERTLFTSSKRKRSEELIGRIRRYADPDR
ncbi:MAG TPA: TAXI family TRAP transporter solute-binding subunit [Rhodopila sp.]